MATRDELVRVGTDLLESGGLARLTLRQIAREAGVSHGAPRHHFPTYESLLAAIARRGLEDLEAELALRLADPDAERAIRGAAQRYVSFAVERPDMFELIARHDLLAGAGGDLRSITGSWFRALARKIQELSPEADERHAMALWSGVHGLAVVTSRRSAEAVTENPPGSDTVIDLLITALLERQSREKEGQADRTRAQR